MRSTAGFIVSLCEIPEIHVNPTSAQYQADGRRTGLKIRSSQEGVGSSPTFGTWCKMLSDRLRVGSAQAALVRFKRIAAVRRRAHHSARMASFNDDKADLTLTRSLFEPILESQPRHFLEISPIGREKKCVIGHRDAGHLQIHGADFDARLAEAVEQVYRVGT